MYFRISLNDKLVKKEKLHCADVIKKDYLHVSFQLRVTVLIILRETAGFERMVFNISDQHRTNLIILQTPANSMLCYDALLTEP